MATFVPPPKLIGSAIQDMIALDRYIVEKRGLSGFVQLAWPTVETEGTFRPNWHIDAVAEHLQGVSMGHIKRLLIAVPPRSSKSTLVAVMWAAYDWLQHPERRFLFSSYAQNLSIRDSTRCRRVIGSPWYQQRWGHKYQLTGDQNTKTRFENDKNGYRLSTSVGGQLTGEGGDFVCIDDPHNVRKTESALTREGTLSWWDEAMSTRLNNPVTGAFVVIQQRVHYKDLIGHILERHGKEYTYLCLPAEYEPDHPHRWIRDPRKEVGELLWTNHMTRATLDALKMALGPYAAAGQLQQRPVPREGGLLKRSWLVIERVVPGDLEFVRAWDLAATTEKLIKSDPDYTATAKIGWSRSRQKWFIVHMQRWREEPHEVNRLIKFHAEQDGTGVKVVLPQDPGQAGKSQAQSLVTMLGSFYVQVELQSGDKTARLMPLASQAGVGNIVLIEGPWNDEFLDEITGFPLAAHDDMVDAAASAFNALSGGTTGLLDFYTQMLADRDAEQAATTAEVIHEQGGTKVVVDTTADLARALLGGAR